MAAPWSKYRQLENLKIHDLVALAGEILPKLTKPGTWSSRKVAEIPDVRTLRYYIQQGLVDRPHGSEAQSSLYGYRHLLQLVAIKVLQNRFLPIRKIREELEGLHEKQLEKKLKLWTAVPPQQWATAWNSWVKPGESSLSRAPHPAQPVESSRPEPDYHVEESAHDYLQSLEEGAEDPKGSQRQSLDQALSAEKNIPQERAFERSLVQDALPVYGKSSGEEEEPKPETGWIRHELYPGIELHVRQDVRLPAGRSFVSALASRLRAILDRWTRRTP